MGKRQLTVLRLATEAGLELDEVLLKLWDAGIDSVTAAGDSIPARHQSRARRALGVATRREIKSPNYWASLFGLDEKAFSQLLQDLGVNLSPSSRSLPKGAVTKLRAEARRRQVSEREAQVEPVRQSPPVASMPEFRWEVIGHRADVRLLTPDEVEKFHYELVNDFQAKHDPIDPPGVRSRALLESAVHRPYTGIGSELKYPTIEMAGASLLHAIIQDHPFHNGNKRTALVSLLVLANENGVMFICHEDDLFKLVLRTAQHGLVDKSYSSLPDREMLYITKWICKNSRLIAKGDRPVPFHRLRRILTTYGCTFEHPKGKGNRINIYRPEKKQSYFSRQRPHRPALQIAYADEGREVQPNTIARVRKKLGLSEEDGIDSSAFYDDAEVSAGEFIRRYRKTLSRLSRL